MGMKKLLEWSGNLLPRGSEVLRFQNHIDFSNEDILHISIWKTTGGIDISDYRDIQVILKGIYYAEVFEEFFPAYSVEIPLPFEFRDSTIGQRYNRLVYHNGFWIGEQLGTLIFTNTRKLEILLKNTGANTLPFIFLVYLERRRTPISWL